MTGTKATKEGAGEAKVRAPRPVVEPKESEPVEASEAGGEAGEPLVSDPLVPEVTGSEAAYTRYLREAMGVDAAAVSTMRADPILAYHNVQRGLAAVMQYEAHLREHLPHVDLGELRALPELALAVVWAAFLVEREALGETRAKLAEASALRRMLRASAEALAEAGVIGAPEAAKVREARSAVDVPGDCATLAALLQKKADLTAGKAAISAAHLARAAEIAADLKARLAPKGPARKGTPSPIEARDRLWTLLALRYERLWAVGAYVFGFAVDAYVPALLARPEGKAKKRGR